MSTIAPKQRGMVLLAAIAILLLLAGLAAFIAKISISQQAASIQDYMEVQAYHAARAGSEWGAYQMFKNTTTPCVASTNLGQINGMFVTVTCQLKVAAGAEIDSGAIYVITSTACSNASSGGCPGNASNHLYIERRLAMMVEAAP